MIWKQEFTLEGLNGSSDNAMAQFVGIEFVEAGEDFLVARMPVTEKTVQPMRILHGGASVVLAETLGSVASILCLEDLTKQTAVGLEINANHIRSVREGSFVLGTVRPLHVGRTTHIWNIEIRNPEGKLTCTSRITVAIVPRNVG